MQLSIPDDQYFMQQALVQARMAFEANEVPVGAVVVLQNRIIARGHNQVEQLTDATAHAEMLAITSAFHALGAKYLPDATLYVTLEPCLMCCGALFWGKIGRVVFGAPDPKNGFKSKTAPHWPLHPKTELVGGVLEVECAALMTAFFRNKR
jgi:tRNA(adenine34) deaminase